MVRTEQHSLEVYQRTRNIMGKEAYEVGGLIGVSLYWSDSSAEEVAGDADADGTLIVALAVPAYTTFICTIAVCSSNLAALVKIGTGDIGDPPTDETWIDVTPRGNCGFMADGNTPIFVYDNITAAAVNVSMFAPLTAYALGTNNDVLHYFNGYLGGLLVPDAPTP